MAHPVEGLGAARVPIVRLGWTLSAFLAISFLICIALGYVITPARDFMPLIFFPGFSWEQPATILWGLIWSVGWGWYAAVLFGLLYNGFGGLTRK